MSSLWFVLADYEREPFEGYDEETARKIAARRDEEQPKLAPHRVVRYDLADPERDKREAETLDRLLSGAPCFDEDLATLRALRDRLRGGAR